MRKLLLALTMTLLLAPVLSQASGSGELMDVDLTTDTASLKRGAELALSVCMSCHNLKYLRWRDLAEVGFTQEEIDVQRGEEEMTARLMSRSSDDMMKESFGLVPPDLSMITRARRGGGRYVYTLFNSFHVTQDGAVDNSLFPGIRMPDVLGYAEATDGKTRDELNAKMKDAASFLVWAADPHAQERRTIGVWVIAYLILLTFLLWRYKVRVWSDLPKDIPR